ncbi:MAG: QueT transporter family protein [Ruminococcaceae bacterium]|nr:QueT transporter family protein [Oscillospiraceae bacterium]
MKSKQKTNFLVTGGLIAALYAVATYFSAALGLAYGGIQFRFSEALTILPAFTPAAIPGLIIGCFIGNLGSPFGVVDILLGTLATALAAVCSYYTRKITLKGLPLLSIFFPVLFNAVIVGTEVAYFLPEGISWIGFWICAAEVALGELVMCYGLGIPLFLILKNSKSSLF